MSEAQRTRSRPKGTTVDLQSVRDQLVDNGLIYFAVVVPWVLVVSLALTLQHGWHLIYLFHVGVAGMAVAGAVFRKQLSYRVRACLLLGMFLVVGTLDLLIFGFLAGGPLVLIVFAVMTTVAFGTRAGLVACVAILWIVAATGTAVHMGGITSSFDTGKYAISGAAWGAVAVTILLFGPVTIIAVGVLHQHLGKSLRDLRESHARYERLVDALTDTDLHHCDVNKWLDDASSPVTKAPGYSVSESSGHVPRFMTDHSVNRKAVKHALRESEEQLRAIADYTYDWETWFSPDGRMMWLNRAVEKLTGYSVRECREMPDYPLPIIHEEDRTEFGERLWQAVAEKASANDIEFRISHKNGHIKWMAISWQPIYDTQNKHIGQRTSCRDITERKQAEAELASATSFLNAVVDMSPFAMWVADSDGVIIRTNRTLRETLNLTDEQLVGKYNVLEDKNLEAQGRMSLMRDVFEKHIPARFRMPWRVADAGDVNFEGGRDLHIDASCFPILNHEGQLQHVVCQWVDVTEQKWAETEREKLITALESQNAELERFTYTVSHDLKSPLITIASYIGMLRQDLDEGAHELVDRDLECISNATSKMEQLLKDVLELSRIGRLINPSEEVSLKELAFEALELVGGQVRERGVQVEISADLPVVYGDRLRLCEVLQNLIDNAVKYMGNQSQPRVEIGSRCDANETICFVRDNGIGIDPRYHEKVFGLFDQLDLKAEGSGVGLALAKRVIEVQGGRIWVESEGPGHGSTFYFTIAARGKTPDHGDPAACSPSY